MNKLYTLVGTSLCQFPGSEFIDDIATPWNTEMEPSISAVKTNDTTTIKIVLTSATTKDANGNLAMYQSLINTLKNDKIKSIIKMLDEFKIFVNLSIYDSNRRVIEEGVRIHTIPASDIIFLNSIMENSDLNYTKGKEFKVTIPFLFPKASLGIVKAPTKQPRYIHIKGVTIMGIPVSENSTAVIKTYNQTLLDTTLPVNSPTIESIAETMVPIYSSSDDGVSFKVIDIVTPPVNLDIDIDVLVSGFTEAYDDTVITDIIASNNDSGTVTPDPGTGGGGSDFYAQYERCDASYPDAGEVVADVDYEEASKTTKCYKYSDVVVDIPDITIGEYVAYVESLVVVSI